MKKSVIILCLSFVCLALKAEPDALLRFREGQKFYRSGNYQSAIKSYSKAIGLDQSFEKAYFNRAIAYFKIHRYISSEKDFKQVIELNRGNASAYCYLGVVLGKQEKYQEAKRYYRQYLKMAPNDSKVYCMLGRISMKEKDDKKAISLFNKAIALDPRNEHAYFFKGYVSSKNGAHEAALKNYTKVLQLNPAHSAALKNRSNVLLRMGYSDDIALFSGIGNKATSAQDYFRQGYNFQNTRRYEDAIEAYTKAIDKDPAYKSAYLNRALAQAELENYKQAIKDISVYMTYRNDRMNYYHRALWYYKDKELRRASKDIYTYMRKGGKAASAYSIQASILIDQKDFDGALLVLKDGLVVHRKDPHLFMKLGGLYYEKENYKKALTAFNKAIDLKSTYAKAYFMRAKTKIKLGHRDGACNDLFFAKQHGYQKATLLELKYCR